MNCCPKSLSIRHIAAVILSALLIMLGVLYYVLYRAHALPQLLAWIPGIEQLVASSMMPQLLHGTSVPSFLHAFATVLMLHAVVHKTAIARIPARLILLLALFGFEFFIGIFDWMDVLAILLGSVAAECAASVLVLTSRDVAVSKISTVPAGLVALISVSGLLAMGSYGSYGGTSECALYNDSGICVEYKRRGVPIYMTYQRLRESVQVERPRSPDRIGRLYLYGDYVFLNEKNQGIHIIDNRDPVAPVNIGFIRVPGNTEIAIRSNYLYADSYVDLVTLDLNDPNNVRLVNRQVDIFPYDVFQNIPYNVSFSGSDINSRNGVVVSYKTVGSRP